MLWVGGAAKNLISSVLSVSFFFGPTLCTKLIKIEKCLCISTKKHGWRDVALMCLQVLEVLSSLAYVLDSELGAL